MSPSAASGSSDMVTASWKALTIQIALSGATTNWRAIVGSATLTMLPSSTAMVIAMARVENAMRRCGLARPSWTWAAAGADIGSGRFKADRPRRALRAPPSSRRPPQIVGVGAVDPDRHDVAGAQRPAGRDVDGAVDLRRIALGAALRLRRAAFVDDDFEALADFRREFLRADRLDALHEALVPARLDVVGHGLKAEIVGGRSLDRLVRESADAIELRFIEPVDKELEVILGLAGKADDEGRPDDKLRADRAPGADALERLFLGRRPPHRLQDFGRSVLERHVDIGQDTAAVHQRDRLVDMRIRVDILQPYPGAERSEFAHDVEKARRRLPAAPFARRVFEVPPVGARVLGDDDELLDACFHQPLRLAQHVARRAR